MSTGRAEFEFASRTGPSARERRERNASLRSDVRAIRSLQRGEKPPTTARQRGRLDVAMEYQSPRARATALAATGSTQRPAPEALAVLRDRRTTATAQRAVAYNPLAGRFTTDSARGFGGSRQVTKASAARAKLTRASQKPTPDAIQTDRGGFISREAAAVAMFGPEEAARRLAKKSAKKPRAKLAAKPEYVGRRRAEP